MGVQVALDMFPARVTLPSGATLRTARVFVANGRVQVYTNDNGRAKLYYDRELLSSSGNTARSLDLQVADGSVKVARTTGCGCGNPLKRFNPWPGEARQIVPL